MDGTCLILRSAGTKVLRCNTASGSHAGEIVLLPCVCLNSAESKNNPIQQEPGADILKGWDVPASAITRTVHAGTCTVCTGCRTCTCRRNVPAGAMYLPVPCTCRRHVPAGAMYLPVHCFSHGQLYVAMLRVGSPTCIHMLITHPEGADAGEVYTDNFEYKEISRA
eukprot:184458-Chlamydomonas_euryale.AAC.3